MPLPADRSLPSTLNARVSHRLLSASYRISSFSNLTAGAGHAVSVLAAEGLDLDEQAPAQAPWADLRADSGAEQTVRLHDFPRGARVGNLIHHVYEHLDFRVDSGELDAQVHASLAQFGYTGESALPLPLQQALSRGVADTLDTPLSADLPGLCLRNLSRADRLDEVEFLMPVRARAQDAELTAARLAEAFRGCAAPARYPGYAEALAALPFGELRGYLKGYIDLVFRHAGRYFIVDYKSNHLGVHASDYHPDRLTPVMAQAHYFLQYHLYAVALHRHLALRLGPSYDHDSHFGGVFYLFVRGMSPEHPPGTGVFADRPDAELLSALSRALSEPPTEQLP